MRDDAKRGGDGGYGDGVRCVLVAHCGHADGAEVHVGAVVANFACDILVSPFLDALAPSFPFLVSRLRTNGPQSLRHQAAMTSLDPDLLETEMVPVCYCWQLYDDGDVQDRCYMRRRGDQLVQDRPFVEGEADDGILSAAREVWILQAMEGTFRCRVRILSEVVATLRVPSENLHSAVDHT